MAKPSTATMMVYAYSSGGILQWPLGAIAPGGVCVESALDARIAT
jgi:hypothetical protein